MEWVLRALNSLGGRVDRVDRVDQVDDVPEFAGMTGGAALLGSPAVFRDERECARIR
ncbi:MAG: hypothetical protein IT365_06130 [Candidatus Hydrogenedentes bacterium]|nr:hypothetical protein [Candidatus Hydrogenedentota bacterium]